MNTESATRATDLATCCGIHPQRVAKLAGTHYIECPRCRARTIPSTADSASRQWTAMQNERARPVLTLRRKQA